MCVCVCVCVCVCACVTHARVHAYVLDNACLSVSARVHVTRGRYLPIPTDRPKHVYTHANHLCVGVDFSLLAKISLPVFAS